VLLPRLLIGIPKILVLMAVLRFLLLAQLSFLRFGNVDNAATSLAHLPGSNHTLNPGKLQ
jgi:hypothetical protein